MHEDIRIAEQYLRKRQSAEDKGYEFSLSFAEFKRLRKSRKCYYTGADLTLGTNGPNSPYDLTLDRIDPGKGYVKGNVVACCHAANVIKGTWENPNTGSGLEMVKQIVAKL